MGYTETNDNRAGSASEREELYRQRYQEILERDALTGVYNRRGFYSHTFDLLKEDPQTEYDICCINIDKFKVINDLFGTEAGDQLLIYLAGVLKRFVINKGTYARLTADNFALCIPRTENLPEKVSAMLQSLLKDYPLQIQIIARCGFYHVHNRTIPVSIMCDRANMAIGEIKGSYHNVYAVYDDKLRNRILLEQEIVNEMKSALDDEQFVPYYQPKFNMETGLLIGAEALVRWIHPIKGIISPGIFIPIFEKNGFIANLDWYIWECVCRDIRRWIRLGYTAVPVSINVSRAELYDQDLPQRLKELLDRYEVPVELIRLEITETTYTENSEYMIEMVGKLRDMGFVILMDDFGSGYSSLNILKDVPVDVLKLDLKFLYNMDENRKANYILKSVVQMARRLELSVIAEGVETENQAEFLLSIGCVRAQGYLYSKPLPRESFEEYLKDPSKVSAGDSDAKTVLSNIDDIMSGVHRKDELEWYRSAVLQLNAMLYEYNIENDLLMIYDLKSEDTSGELFKIEISGLQDKVTNHGFVHPEDVDNILEVLRSPRDHDVQIRFHHLGEDPGFRWYRMKGRVHYTSDGKPLTMIGVLQDISQEKEDEAVLEMLKLADHLSDRFDGVQGFLSAIGRGFCCEQVGFLVIKAEKKANRGGICWNRESGFVMMKSQDSIQAVCDYIEDVRADEYGVSIVNLPARIPDTPEEVWDFFGEPPVMFVGVDGIVSSDLSLLLVLEYPKGGKSLREEDRRMLSALMANVTSVFSKWVSAIRERQNTSLYRLAFKNSGMNLWEWDIAGKMLHRSNAPAERDGQGEWVENVPEYFIEKGMIHPDYVEDYRRTYHQLELGIDATVMVKKLYPDGDYHWLRIAYKVVRDRNGAPVKAVGFGEDVNRLSMDMVLTRERLRTHEHISILRGSWIRCDLQDDKIVSFFPKSERLHEGESYAKLIRAMADVMVCEEWRAVFLRKLSIDNLVEHYREGIYCSTFRFRYYDENRTRHWRELNLDVTKDPENGHIMCFCYISSADEKMRIAAYAGRMIQEDAYLKVLKKESFDLVVSRCLLKEPDNFSALLVVDMDKFEMIKATFGENYSREILRNCVNLINAIMPPDTLVGQILSDRFGVFVPHIPSPGEMLTLLLVMHKCLHFAFQIGNAGYVLSASIGLAYAEPGKGYEELLAEAEKAMLEEKNMEA